MSTDSYRRKSPNQKPRRCLFCDRWIVPGRMKEHLRSCERVKLAVTGARGSQRAGASTRFTFATKSTPNLVKSKVCAGTLRSQPAWLSQILGRVTKSGKSRLIKCAYRPSLRMAGSDWRKPTARSVTVDAGCRRDGL